jgi:hypothetical protein
MDADAQPEPPRLAARPADWWDRNWKWFLPVVILSGTAVVCAFVAMVLTVVISTVRSTDAYQESLRRARGSPAVVLALGSPIREGFLVQGSFTTTGPTGKADFAIPISGPKGDGTLYVDANESVGEWHYERVVVTVAATGARIDLSDPPKATGRAF